MLYLLHKPDGPPLGAGAGRGPLLAGSLAAAAPGPGARIAPEGALVLPDGAWLVLPGDAPLALPA